MEYWISERTVQHFPKVRIQKPKDFNEIKEKIEEGIEQGAEIIEEQIDKVVKDKKGK